jgi:uncharacterized protein YutD
MSKEKEYTRTITDPLMEPYFITVDDNCMTVNIKIMPDARYTDSGKEYNKIIGHYSNLTSALKSIAKDKTNSQSYDSLHNYIQEYKSITEKLTQIISI